MRGLELTQLGDQLRDQAFLPFCFMVSGLSLCFFEFLLTLDGTEASYFLQQRATVDDFLVYLIPAVAFIFNSGLPTVYLAVGVCIFRHKVSGGRCVIPN